LSSAARNAWGAVMYTVTDLGGNFDVNSRVNAINNSGQAVGVSYTNDNDSWFAFLYSGGSMQDLGTLGGPNSLANGINANGQVVGGGRYDWQRHLARLPLQRRFHARPRHTRRSIQRRLRHQ
jgi:probable HAF family extracellular repeat protein